METIYVRAIPKKIEITETYYYEKYISTNDSLEEREPPKGKIDIVIPYDGNKYFKKEAIQDTKQQIGNKFSSINANALIGHLSLRNQEQTDLEDLLYQSGKYQAIPILIPVAGSTFSMPEQLGSDLHRCEIGHEYSPRSPEIKPVYPEVRVLDDFMLFLPDPEELEDLPASRCEELADQIINKKVFLGQQGRSRSLKGKLFVGIKARLSLPQHLNPRPNPSIKRVSMEWPTLTHLESLKLYHISTTNTGHFLEEAGLIFNSVNGSIEWTDITMSQLISQRQDFVSPLMLLGVSQPGEIYQQTSLKGKIEIEIPEILLSTLEADFYKFDGQKLESLLAECSQRKTRIITNFEVDLAQAFAKGERFTSQELVFDNILPEDANLRTIRDVLEDQGFTCIVKAPSTQSNRTDKNTTWVLSAWRSEDLKKLVLWLIVKGEQKSTSVSIKQGNRTFAEREVNGSLTIYMLGKLPYDNYSLLKSMNSLQEELRQRLAPVRQSG